MERFCGALQPAIKSRRHPYPSIDNYVVASVQLSQVKLRFNLTETLRLRPPTSDTVRGAFSNPAWKYLVAYPIFKVILY